MTDDVNRRITLASRPVGFPKDTDFRMRIFFAENYPRNLLRQGLAQKAKFF